jgi:hypothetical protein
MELLNKMRVKDLLTQELKVKSKIKILIKKIEIKGYLINIL